MKQTNQTNQSTTTEEMNRIELIIGKIMRGGVFGATIVMIIGMILLFVHQSGGYASANTWPTTAHAIVAGMLAFKAFAWLMAGIFLLILTPVLRVIISIYAFFKEGDTLYVIITTIVLIILIISFFIGVHE